MKKILKGISLLPQKAAGVTLFILIFFPSLSFGDNLRITIIPSSNSNAYTTTANHIKSAIKKTNDKSIRIRTIGVEDLYKNKGTLPKDTDVFVPIGQRALKETIKYSDSVPVLATLISEFGYREIIKNNPKKDLNIGAIFIDQPIKRHLRFSQIVLPDIGKFGFIISNNNHAGIDKLKLMLDENDYHIEVVNHDDNIISSLSNVLKFANAVIALPDPMIFNLRTTRSILLSTYRKRKPIIGFSYAYVKAGALAAIYSTPELIGKQTGELVGHLSQQLRKQGKIDELPVLHAKYFSISVNNRVSRSLGLPIPDSETLEKELLRIEKGQHE